jgi:hypothetical protein
MLFIITILSLVSQTLILYQNKKFIKHKKAAILILPNVWANTRFAPTSDAGFLAIVGANLVFARS